MIQVYGEGFSGGDVAMVISSPNNTVRGLSIYRSYWAIQLSGVNSTGNRIVGNFIGTNAAGTYDYQVSNVLDQAGVEIGNGASYNHIGSPVLADRNVISGNPYSGVRVNHSNTVGNIIQNNMVNLTPDGNGALYQYVAGIDVQWGARDTLVGGYAENEGNVVVNVTNYGIDLSHSSKNNKVVGNYLGTDVTGTAVYSYTDNLIGLAIKDDTIGNTIEYNVIGGNRWDGIWHRHNITGRNTFRYNRIGVGVDGSDIGNVRYGIHLTGHDDIYEYNIIANNGNDGVYISNYLGGNYYSSGPEYTEGNRLSNNSFYDNGGISIDISGATTTSVLPRSPVRARTTPAARHVASCTIELYISDGGEGRQMIATTTASSGGSWSISDPILGGETVVALAINSGDDTSEFSNSRSIPGGNDGGTNVAPTISNIADRYSEQWDTESFSVNASDSNGDTLLYSALNLPNGVTIDPLTGFVSGQVRSGGEHLVVIMVDDGQVVTQTTFSWFSNQQPTVQAIPDIETAGGATVDIEIEGSDPDGDTITFTASGLPTGLSIDAAGRITGSPTAGGTYNVSITVTDPGGRSATSGFTWTITAPYSCTVDGATLTWTDEGASTYFVFGIRADGSTNYVGGFSGPERHHQRPGPLLSGPLLAERQCHRCRV